MNKERNIVKEFIDARPAIKQRFIAERLGISDMMVSHYVAGRRKMAEKHMVKFKELASEYGWKV